MNTITLAPLVQMLLKVADYIPVKWRNGFFVYNVYLQIGLDKESTYKRNILSKLNACLRLLLYTAL